MEIIKKHVDTVVFLGGILSAFIWMNSQFSAVRKDILGVKTELDEMKTDIAVMKTVMIMKGIMPEALAKNVPD